MDRYSEANSNNKLFFSVLNFFFLVGLLMQKTPKVIFCNICGHGAFSPLKLVGHIGQHQAIFFCGVNGCTATYTLKESFQCHLRISHPRFYPIILDELELMPESIFKFGQSVNVNDSSSEFFQPLVGPADISL